jgi:hypothetical protein
MVFLQLLDLGTMMSQASSQEIFVHCPCAVFGIAIHRRRDALADDARIPAGEASNALRPW